MFPLRVSGAISLAFFLSVFSLDSISYSLSAKFGVSFPIGFFGILLGFFAFFIFCVSFFKSFEIYKQAILFCFLLMFIIILDSRYGGSIDLYYFLKFLCFFSSGVYFSNWWLNCNNKIKYFKIFLLLSLISGVFGFLARSAESYNYLRIADGITLTSLLAIACYGRLNYKAIIIFIITAIFLYLTGSRAGLFLFLFSFSFYYFWERGFLRAFLVFSVFSLAFYFYFLGVYQSLESVHDNRFVRLIFERDMDTSLNSRKMLQDYALETIQSNPLWGSYGYYREIYGDGGYSHDFISFIAEFGLVGAFVFILLLTPQLIVIFKFIFNRNRMHQYSLVVLYSSYSVLGILVAKSFFWSVFYFVSGLCFGYLYSEKTRKYLNENIISSPVAIK